MIAAVHTGLSGKSGADGRKLRLVALRVKPGQDEALGRGQGREGLSQRSPGQESAVAEGRGRIQQHQVQVPVQLKMLEAVVQQKEVGLELLPGGQPRGITAGPGIDRHPGQGPGQPVRLFAHLRGFFIGMLAVGDAGDAAALPAVAPAEDGRLCCPGPGAAGPDRPPTGFCRCRPPSGCRRSPPGRAVFSIGANPGHRGCAATRPPGHRAGPGTAAPAGPRGRQAGLRPGPPEAAGKVMPVRPHSLRYRRFRRLLGRVSSWSAASASSSRANCIS